MKQQRLSFLLLLVGFVGLISGEVQASSEPAVRFTQFPSAYHRPPDSSDATTGWWFSVGSTEIVITHLGLYDRWPGGFDSEHQIAIWKEGNPTPLVTATIPTGVGNSDNFYYLDVEDVVLSANSGNYAIGAFWLMGQTDWEVANVAYQVSPYISYLGADQVLGDFRMPGPPDLGQELFGPNFLLTPEPTTFLLLGLGVVMLRKRGV